MNSFRETVTTASANSITVFRILLVFVVLLFYDSGVNLAIAAFFLTLLIIYLDSLDGFVARKLKVASDFGALLDIAGDRIVENTFWIYYAARGDISYWIPVIVVTRGFLVDMVRSVAFAEGHTPFGEKTMMRSRVTRFLVASPFSRTTYAVSKVFAFSWLGGLIALQKGIAAGYWSVDAETLDLLVLIGQFFAYLALAFCIIRGVPVLIDGKDFMLAKRYPRQIKDEG